LRLRKYFVSDGLVSNCGYDIIRKDRSRRGGGVCSISYKTRNDLVPDGLEAVCLEICKPNSRTFIVASVYRPPNASSAFFDAFEKMIGLIDDENKELRILGDLNCDMLIRVSLTNQQNTESYLSITSINPALRAHE
jgi:hypothetical protein